MLLAEVVTVSEAVAATPKRSEKVRLLAGVVRSAPAEEVAMVVSWLAGELRQRRTGIGWAALRELPPPAAVAALPVLTVDDVLATAAVESGPGSAGRRAELVRSLFGQATAAEQQFLRHLITGELRQGALDGVMTDAVAVATDLDRAVVRRAVMLRGSIPDTAVLARTGGLPALAAVTLRVGHGVLPMLASTARSAGAAVEMLLAAHRAASEGATGYGADVVVDDKLDGIRVQVHRDGDTVWVFSRSLDDITARVPGIVRSVLALPARVVVLDGEAIGLRADGRPQAFQDTGSRAARRSPSPEPVGEDGGPDDGLVLRVFDLLHVEGTDLLDEPLSVRDEALRAVVPPELRVARTVTADPAAAEAALADALRRGHEGVVVKSPSSTYEAGRRGSGWLKVKPVHTFDLVVIAVEWGSGRRTGWLSNLHLAARGADGSLVMVGKTFKGLTDAVLRWQTEQLLARETGRRGHTVEVRPELVVEIAVDGVQRSTRYAGGAALRFARVVAYRPDKSTADADTIDTVRTLLPVDDAGTS